MIIRFIFAAAVFLGAFFNAAFFRASAAEPALRCQWTNPNTARQMTLDFRENPMIIAPPGDTVTLSAFGGSAGGAAGGGAGGAQGVVTVLKDGQAIRTAPAVSLTAPADPGAYYIPLAVEASGARRETEICVIVPHTAALRTASNGWDVVVDGTDVGRYRQPARSGNLKVKNNPDSYMPPVLWLRVTRQNAPFEVVPGVTAGDLVIPSEDTGEKHTDLVPVHYPMWQTIVAMRAEMDRRGIPAAALKIISMFRASAYNRGVGSGAYGRHIYGDAFDFYIDLENDGKASDLNRDRKRDWRDAYPIVALLEDLQDDGKIPMGGIGIYNTVGGDHEVTMHLDMRGHRATWGYLTRANGRRGEFTWQSVRFEELDRHEENLAAERARKEGRKYSRPRREPLQ